MIDPGEIGRATDFIYESEKDVTPADDEGRVPKLEIDAKLARAFIHLNQKSALLAGEAITGATTPQACFIMSEQRINRFKLAHTSFHGVENDFEVFNNGAGSDNRIGHRFNSGANDFLKGVAIEGSTEGSLSGHNYIVELFAVDGSNNPTGAALGSQAFTSAQFVSTSDSDDSYFYIEFATAIAISQSTNYILVFRETTTTGSSTVNIHLYVNSGAGTSRYSSNGGSTWNAGYPSQGGGGLANVIIYGNITQTVGRVYLSDADDADRNYFDGFVYQTVSAGGSVNLLWGIDIPFFSSLLPGTDYYLSTTPGGITATAAKGKKVGTAKSTTTIAPNHRPEISEQYNSNLGSEYDFTTSVVPFSADALVGISGGSVGQLYVTMSKKFHEALFGYDDKTHRSSQEITNEKKDITIFVKQGEYVRTQGGGVGAGSFLIRYQL